MQTYSPIPLRPLKSNVRAAGDPQALVWLKSMGVVVVDEFGAWRLSDLGERAMRRFNESCTAPRVATEVADV